MPVWAACLWPSSVSSISWSGGPRTTRRAASSAKYTLPFLAWLRADSACRTMTSRDGRCTATPYPWARYGSASEPAEQRRGDGDRGGGGAGEHGEVQRQPRRG